MRLYATATLKTSTGWLSAMVPPRQEAERRLRAGVRDAASRIGPATPYTMSGPVTLEIRLRNRIMAEWLALVNGIERLDAYTIRYRSEDMIGISRFLMFLTSIRKAIE